MAKNFPLRRAQLIAPFGVGAMVVVRDGTSVISGGLDHWYEREDNDNDSRTLDISEYRIEEWRLQQLLGVTHFRLPPDFRRKNAGEQIANSNLSVPFLRFPQWHFCLKCKRLIELPLSARGKQKCDACAVGRKTSFLAQVPFVAICDHGHIQDFPWREWVHKSVNATCRSGMKIVSTGGASLGAQKVVCECGAERTLAQITSADPDGSTELSRKLEEGGQPYLCPGHHPWLGTPAGKGCGQNIRGSLRSASNVYFAEVRSAIYLPRGNKATPPDLVELLENPPLSTLLQLLRSIGPVNLSMLRGQQGQLLQAYTDEQIKSAIEIVRPGRAPIAPEDRPVVGDDVETAFRRDEFRALRIDRTEEQLTVQKKSLESYDPFMSEFFAQVMLIPRLRETRALAGFTRVLSETDQTSDQKRALLWRTTPSNNEIWLPAYQVYGEGIFLEFNETRLQQWEQRNDVQQRLKQLTKKYQRIQESRRLRERPIGPRFLLLHTFAHVLMNQLTFECGYSSAALRERLYVSNNPHGPMAGLLIYTAAGDAEGTLGGLVRMGQPGYLEPAIQRAVEGTRWCSADPVCMEIGSQGGQGPDSCNLAACHNCALVPETACEEFNRFLDRALIIGELSNNRLGFFRTLGK